MINYYSLLVWRDRVRRLATDPVVMRSSPAEGHIRCALLVDQPKYVESTFMVISLLSGKTVNSTNIFNCSYIDDCSLRG